MSDFVSHDADILGTPTREENDLHRLIRDQGLRRYGVFLVTGEGKILPDGSEDASGYVVDEAGRVFFFWLDWDDQLEGVTFAKWKSIEPDADWEDEPEYLEARRAAGLEAVPG